MILAISLVLGVTTLPLMASGYHYYNWIIEYFKIPAFLTALGLLPILFSSRKYFLVSTISFLSLAFFLNLAFQYTVYLAQMGGEWTPSNCPDFKPPVAQYQNYNLIEGAGYFIHETKVNGLIYKELSHKWELDPDCLTKFNLKNSHQSIIYDSCKNELIVK